jgi:hypothetical protein
MSSTSKNFWRQVANEHSIFATAEWESIELSTERWISFTSPGSIAMRWRWLSKMPALLIRSTSLYRVKLRIKSVNQIIVSVMKMLRSRPRYEYVTSSHLIAALNQTSLLDSLNNSSVNQISRFIDHAQTLNERAEKWTRNLRRKFYWTIHEEIHLMIFTSRSENNIKTTNKRIEIDIEAFYLVNRKIQINLDAS